MRPLLLNITGFGTYCKPTQINLEQLGTSGLYLITGDTGSGKTTIFDAITYALYGTVNGQNRQVSMLRSTFADLDTPTEVELVFEYKGERYTVKRNPDYERRAKRGEGVIKQAADATLIKPDGTVITQNTKVTSYITELFGIDKNQFSQIVMIAQGDFQQLLMENTERRQEIFRKLFKTDYYLKLQLMLSDAENDIKKTVNERKAAIKNNIDNLVCKEDSLLKIDVETAKTTGLPVTEVFELTQKLIDEDTKEKDAVDKAEKENQGELEKITELLTKAQNNDLLKKSLEEKESELKAIRITHDELKKVLQEHKDSENELKNKEADLAVKKQKMQNYDKLEELEEAAGQLSKNKEASKKAQEKALAELESLKQKKNELIEEQKKLSGTDTKLVNLENEKSKLSERSEKVSTLKILLEEYAELNVNLNDAQKKYKALQKDFEEKDELCRQKRKLFMDEQAGILASKLEAGSPCPVCGSLEHPKLAVITQKAPTQTELEELQQAVDQADKLMTDANAACSIANTNVENAQKRIAEESKKLFNDKADDDYGALEKVCREETDSLKQKIAELEKQIETENTNVQRKEQIEKSLPELEEQLTTTEKSERLSANEVLALEEKLKAAENQSNELKKTLEYAGKTEAQAALDKLDEEITLMKQASEKAQTDYDKINEDIKTLDGQIIQIKGQLEKADEIDSQALTKEQEKLRALKEELTQKRSELDVRLGKNKGALEKIKAGAAELAGLEEKQTWITALSKTANGNLAGGKERIKLETYIQMTYFDKIIAHANKRLMIMSDNQYELVRKKEASDLRIQTGLELDVIDHYNGGQRSVKSLSGGESFQASLALALGLSDEVRRSSGGIKIDSMFVDEGFGTLDSEALQKAFKALSGITEGNRLVGIISHVDLLKEKIDRQIVVKKERTGGSTVKLMV